MFFLAGQQERSLRFRTLVFEMLLNGIQQFCAPVLSAPLRGDIDAVYDGNLLFHVAGGKADQFIPSAQAKNGTICLCEERLPVSCDREGAEFGQIVFSGGGEKK